MNRETDGMCVPSVFVCSAIASRPWAYRPASARIGWEREGMAVRRCGDHGRRTAGILLGLTGVLTVFLCLPMECLLIALGGAMTGIGLMLLSE